MPQFKYPSPLPGYQTSPIHGRIYLGIGQLFIASSNLSGADVDQDAYDYWINSTNNAMIAGLLYNNVEYNPILEFDDIYSGVPKTLKKRLLKGQKFSLTASLAEINIAAVNIFAPSIGSSPPFGGIVPDTNGILPLPILCATFLGIEATTGGGIKIVFPYCFIKGDVKWKLTQTGITLIENLTIDAAGDSQPFIYLS